MTRTKLWQALACVAMLAPASLVSAQGTTGSISGFVTDDTGGALPGATVTVRHVETDQKRALLTDSAGRYRAQQLVPGRYEVTVELQGFRTARDGPDAECRPGRRREHSVEGWRSRRAGHGHR